MSFVEERLLECVSYGTEGGPTWLTRRIGLKSGVIRRNAMRSRPLYRFVVLYKNLNDADHQRVIDAFNACMGGVFGFRLKDHADYQAVDELVGVGTGSPQSIQLARLYEFGTRNVSRPIRKPVAGTVSLTANGVPISSSVDTTTGIVTFTATNGHVVRWSGEFDVPVFFSDDELSFSIDERSSDGGFFLNANVALEEDISE